MHYRITSEETIILRDGKPFGEYGTFGGNSYKWPLPQTLSGMIRTAVGFNRDSHFFDSEENCQNILNVKLQRIIAAACFSGTWEPLFPVPADLVFYRHQNRSFEIETLIYKTITEERGTDIPWKNWLFPFSEKSGKPAKSLPFFCKNLFYQRYLKNDAFENAIEFHEAGISDPVGDVRIHNSLDYRTLTTEEGKLFSNRGVYLKSIEHSEEIPLGISFSIEGAEENEIHSEAFLGAERKRVELTPCTSLFPEFPPIFTNKKFLKIILTTHGDFGGWCPLWLKPDSEKPETEYVFIPGTEWRVRLRSAVISGWEGISGWDYRKNNQHTQRKPKALKKLVKPGSVYILEIEKESDSEKIANHFWGGQFVYNSPDYGYNQTITGNCTVISS